MAKTNRKRHIKRLAFCVAVVIAVITTALWIAYGFMPYTISESPAFIPPDTISEHDMTVVNSCALLMNTKGIMAYNKKGEYQWDYALKTAKPYLVSDGSRFAVADFENGIAWNFRNKKNNYSVQSDVPITGVIINKAGYMGIISSDYGYKSVLTVYDDYGTEFYKWYSGETYITAAALSDNNKYLAVAGIKATTKSPQTVLSFFYTNDSTVQKQVLLDNCVAYKLMYNGSNVYLLTDKGVYCYTKNGELKAGYPFVGRALHAFSFSDAKNITLALSCTDEAGSMLANSSIVCLNAKLEKKMETDVDFEISSIDARDGYIVATGLRNVCLYQNNGKLKARTMLSGESDQIRLFDKGKAFVTLSGSTIYVYEIHKGF